jgi:putative FmdB family regulatory protein
MPTYPYRCQSCGQCFEKYWPLRRYRAVAMCVCGLWARRIITAPLLVSAQPDVCYDSPIDGRPITSMAAREEDMKRNHCRPYDPEMKTDVQNRRKAEDAALDASIDAHVEASIAKMSTTQRGQLASDLLDKSADVTYTRTTPVGG